MVLYLLYQAALGYSLFLCHEFESEDIGKNTNAVRNCVSDLKEFSKVVKLVAFDPFQSALHALNQITAFSLGQMTDELHRFLVLALPKPEEGNNSKLSVGLAEPKLGSHIFQVTKVPCQTNEFILEVLRGVQLHIDRIINPSMKPFYTIPSKRRKLSASSPDWANLHTDILESVLKRMTCFDIIRFKHVCRSWKIAVLNLCLISNPSSQPPYMIWSTTDNRGCCFFNFARQKLHHEFNNFWGDLNIYCIGCSKGWLILHVVDEERRSSVFIFNPYCFEARKIVIPSDTLPHYMLIRKFYRTHLTSDPIRSGGRFGVIFLMCNKVKLLLQDSYHPENNKWIEVPLTSSSFYSLGAACLRKALDFQWTSKLASTIDSPHFSEMTRNIPPREIYWRPWVNNYIILYLVESGVDILLVTRIIGSLLENGQQVYATKYFDVFTYNFDDRRWVKVDSLGDRSLFLGGDHSLSFSVLDIQGWQGNSIYFTDHISSISNETGVDMGVFSLEDRSIKQLTWRCQREQTTI
ncbi:hypothetical protein ACET3Z_023707 [Daucus carota]